MFTLQATGTRPYLLRIYIFRCSRINPPYPTRELP